MSQIGKLLGNPKSSLELRDDEVFVLPRCDLGIEFEFEGVKTSKPKLAEIKGSYWEEHKENSLHDSGLEFAFRQPMFGKDVIEAVSALLKAAKDEQWRISLRTGLHVHQEVRDMTYAQLVGELTYYALLEPALYAWAGDDRESNNFCAPWYKCEGSVYDAANIVHLMYKRLQSERAESLLQACENFHKYAGLNLRPLHNFGSIEFRHLKTTIDPTRVFKWINIILSLKKAALNSPDSTMVIVTQSTKQGFKKLVYNIFGEELADEILKCDPDVPDKIRSLGVPNAVEFLAGMQQAASFSNSRTGEGKSHKGVDLWLASKKGEEPVVKKETGLSGLNVGQVYIDEAVNFPSTFFSFSPVGPSYINDEAYILEPEPVSEADDPPTSSSEEE